MSSSEVLLSDCPWYLCLITKNRHYHHLEHTHTSWYSYSHFNFLFHIWYTMVAFFSRLLTSPSTLQFFPLLSPGRRFSNYGQVVLILDVLDVSGCWCPPLYVRNSPPLVVYSILHPPGVVSTVSLEDLIHKTLEEEWRENTALHDSPLNSELLRLRSISSPYQMPCAHVLLFDEVS